MEKAPERIIGLISRAGKKHPMHSKSTFPLPLRERARERGAQKTVSAANANSTLKTVVQFQNLLSTSLIKGNQAIYQQG